MMFRCSMLLRLIVSCLSLWSVVASLLPKVAVADSRPNILIILADDLGYHDVGFNGLEDFTTPNLDALAASGVVCRNGYASHPFCAPTRAGLLTGRYQHRFGFEGNPTRAHPERGLPETEVTLANLLERSGYRTVGIGKWHLGTAREHHPVRRGFQEYFGFLEGQRSYFKTDCKWWTLGADDQVVVRPATSSSRTDYLTDMLTDEAVHYIRQSPSDQPFFMYLAYSAPHGPLEATPQWLGRVGDIQPSKRRTYAAMVTSLDDGVGRIRRTLQQQGIANNTLIFFMSDNGGITPVNAARNTPFRGLKGTLLEGGIHVPYVVSFPGTIPANSELQHPVMSFDAFATSLAAAGVERDLATPVDAKNLLPLLSGQTTAAPHETLYWRTGNGFQLAARRGNLKFLHIDGLPPRWFDLQQDFQERHSLEAEQENVRPSARRQLAVQARRWSNEIPKTEFSVHGLKLEQQWRAVGLKSAPRVRVFP